MTGSRGRQRGAATAEVALATPLLLAVTAALVWLMAVAAAQVRTVDAARETARAVARGDSTAEAVALGDRVAPDGVRITVRREGGRVVVRAAGRLAGANGLFGSLPGADLEAGAVALSEEDAGDGG